MPASQAHALLCLCENDPIPMQELARILHVAPSTATRMIEQMEKVGWVARSGDPDDRRRVLIQLLPAGEERAWNLQGLARQVLWNRSAGLSEPDRIIDGVARLASLL